MNLLLEIVIWLIVVAFKFITWLLKAVAGLPQSSSKPKKAPRPRQTKKIAQTPRPRQSRDENLAARLVAIRQRSEKIAQSIVRDRANEKFGPVIKQIGERAHKAAAGLAQTTTQAKANRVASRSSFVLDQLEVFITHRQQDGLRRDLGDADALVNACYRPFVDFACVNRVSLTRAVPFTLLTAFDLAIWIELVSFGLLPIFLPPQFFHRLAWWPALAHEIGHAVFASGGEVDEKLRDQLGLPEEELGTYPLQVVNDRVDPSELHRVVGGWFEEIFSDIFGTLMLGPAYCHTMVELFAPHEPSTTGLSEVQLDDTQTAYDVHPPRHLRVLTCCHVLRLAGQEQAADSILETWRRRRGEVSDFGFPTVVGLVAIPTSAMTQIVFALVTRMYRQPLDAFDGHPLASIPSLDYGPAASAAADSIADRLLLRRPVRSSDARAVISGAILAWKQEPDRESEFLERARIAVVGEAEWAEKTSTSKSYAHSQRSPGSELRDAFLTHLVLAPPKGLRKARRSP